MNEISKPRDHHFKGREQADYDSLRAAGRSAYDELRWSKAVSHQVAFEQARASFGLKPASLLGFGVER